MEKKLRGLQKKVKSDIDTSFGKLKAELSLLHSNHQIVESKQADLEEQFKNMPAAAPSSEGAVEELRA